MQDPDLDAGAASAFRALAEGDALRVEGAYIENELTEDEQAVYDEEYASELADSEAATEDVPPYLEAEFGVPYALGAPFVAMLFSQDGNDGIDDGFDDPPHTEEHLLDPASYLGDDDSIEVEVEVDLPEDAEVIEESTFGATSWYLMLAERIDPKQALEAALGWNDDAYASYRQDGTVCVQARFAGDEPTDEDEMREALDAWVAAMPGGEAEVIEVAGRPGFRACDPGEAVDLELTDRSETSLYLPNLWAYLVADASAIVDPDESRCYARTVIDDLTYEQIIDPEGTAFAGDAWRKARSDALDACET